MLSILNEGDNYTVNSLTSASSTDFGGISVLDEITPLGISIPLSFTFFRQRSLVEVQKSPHSITATSSG